MNLVDPLTAPESSPTDKPLAPHDHPARSFGRELSRLRRERRKLGRDMATLTGLCASRYCEVEQGIIRHLGNEQFGKAVAALELSAEEVTSLREQLTAARAWEPLTMHDLFTRAEVMPLFPPRKADGTWMTPPEIERMVDQVFAGAGA